MIKIMISITFKNLFVNSIMIIIICIVLSQDEQRRKSMPTGGGRRKISLEAVFKTTCSKCGVAGHLAKDCFQVNID